MQLSGYLSTPEASRIRGRTPLPSPLPVDGEGEPEATVNYPEGRGWGDESRRHMTLEEEASSAFCRRDGEHLGYMDGVSRSGGSGRLRWPPRLGNLGYDDGASRVLTDAGVLHDDADLLVAHPTI